MNMDGRQFEALLMCVLWISAKENPEILKDVEHSLDQKFQEIFIYPAVLPIPDKDMHLESVVKAAKGYLDDNKLTDSEVLEFIDSRLKDLDEHRLMSFCDALSHHTTKDNILSNEEKEVLSILEHKYNFAKDILRKSEKQIPSFEKVKPPKKRGLLFIMSLFGLILLLFTGYSAWIYYGKINQNNKYNMSEVLANHPKLVFKKVQFYKYIVLGTPDNPGGISKYLKKLKLFHVKGSADFQFNMDNVVVDDEKTDPVNKILHLKYKPESSGFPLTVDVNIRPEDIYEVPVDEAPDPISRGTAEKVAKKLAVPAAILGGVAGAKAGSTILSSFRMLGKILGTGLGGVGGAAAAGGGTYVMTSNFLTGLKGQGLTDC